MVGYNKMESEQLGRTLAKLLLLRREACWQHEGRDDGRDDDQEGGEERGARPPHDVELIGEYPAAAPRLWPQSLLAVEVGG